jgi:nitroimidazol reductase NimA-like FMN-containing flavoprotein (pyridoxamine 5'-phosphate oxidase superfamily)/GNAT superfamily N-acetyltransferase
MRREIFRMPREGALALLARAPFVHLATTDNEGRPILRTVHGVISDGWLCFHAAPAGEKMEALGRSAVVTYEEVVAHIPSYFLNAERACPATTLYESVQVHGVLERIDDEDAKARALTALMTRFQAEGGHAPIDPLHPRYDALYRSAVRGIMVAGVRLDDVDGKSKLGQNRTPAEVGRVLEGLWRRGHAGDATAIERIRRGNTAHEVPPFLGGPMETRLHVAFDERFTAKTVELLRGAYWNTGVDDDAIARAQRGSTAWVGATLAGENGGELVGCARAISDGAKWAWIYDVAVEPSLQRRGVGRSLVRLLLEHPAVRACRAIALRTRDAHGVYRGVGFVDGEGGWSEGSSTMILRRPPPAPIGCNERSQAP